MEKLVIHKARITAEAQFDYEEVLSAVMPKRDVKFQIEEYLCIESAARRLPAYGRLRLKYLDENTGEMLMLFVYRAERIRCMQMWDVKGVCRYGDYSEESEDEGQIRQWLETSVNPLPRRDWVWDYRLRLEMQERLRILEEGGREDKIMAEVKELLKNYKLNKLRVDVGDKNDGAIMELADKMKFLEDCIERIDDEERDIIRCKYVDGIPLRQISRRMNMADTTIRRHVERALKMIETCFTERFGK